MIGMKKWRKEACRYVNDLFRTQSFLGVCQITIALTLAVFLADYYNVPSKVLALVPEPVLLVAAAGAGLMLLCWIASLHATDLLKVPTFHLIDAAAFVSLPTVTVWFLLQAWLGVFCVYKFVIFLACAGLCMSVICCRISFRCRQLEKQTSGLVDLRDLYENTFETMPGKPILVQEKDVDYDLLERDGVINQLYRTILYSQPDNGYVISLEGDWGSGKTTILNHTRHLLEQDTDNRFILIDNFDPWVYGSQEALLLAMYDTLLRSIGVRYSPYRSKKLLEQLSSVVTKEYAAGSILHSLFFGGNSPDDSLMKIRQQISDFITATNKTVVFFIDNLDRASADNIVLLLKIISTVFDFPKVVYVLAFDRGRMDNILGETREMNVRYMEKIIQQEIKVPPIGKAERERVYFACIKNLLTTYGVEAEEVQKYHAICNVILQKAPELRKFKRLINSAFSMTFCDNNILDKRDLLGLEVIGFLDRELYEEIRRHPKFFVSHDKYTDWQTFDFGLQREKLNQEGTEYFKILFAKYAAYEELLQEMFPYVRKYKNRVELISTYEGEDPDADEIARRARICSGKYFSLYFSYGSNQYLRIKKAVEAYVQQINDAADGNAARKTVLDMLEVAAQEEQVEWIERFENYLEQINETRKLDVAKTLMDNTQHISEEHSFLRLSSRARAEVIIAELLMQCPKADFEEYMDSIAHRYEFIHNISSVLRWMQSGSRRFSVNDLEERTEKVQSVFNGLCQEIVEQRISLYEDTYYRPGSIWALYHHLEEANRTVFDDYISDILTGKYVYRILWDTIGCSFGSGGYKYHIREENFRPLFANPELVDKLLEKRPPETDDERFVFRVYQVFKHGGKDEFGEASVLTAEAVELSL